MKAWLYIVTTGIIFGLGGLVTKYLLDNGLDPIFGTTVMMSFTAVSALPLRGRASRLPGRGVGLALLAGALYAGGPALLLNLGFEQLPVSVNTLVFALAPVFAALAAHFLSANDRFSPGKALGLAAAVAGVGLLAGTLSSVPAVMLAFPLAAAVLSGSSLVLVKRLSTNYPPVATLAPMMAGAALLSLILTVALDRFGSVPLEHWLIMAAMGVSGVAGFGAVLAASEIASASQTSLSGYLIPLIGVIGGVLVFQEAFGWRIVLGAALILGGVVLVGQARRAAGDTLEVIASAEVVAPAGSDG